MTITTSENSISIESEGDISLKAANGTILLESKEVAITSSAAAKVEAGSSLDLTSSAAMKLQGATIDLN